MNQCSADGCYSYAINDHPESGLCDVCWWKERAERLRRFIQQDADNDCTCDCCISAKAETLAFLENDERRINES